MIPVLTISIIKLTHLMQDLHILNHHFLPDPQKNHVLYKLQCMESSPPAPGWNICNRRKNFIAYLREAGFRTHRDETFSCKNIEKLIIIIKKPRKFEISLKKFSPNLDSNPQPSVLEISHFSANGTFYDHQNVFTFWPTISQQPYKKLSPNFSRPFIGSHLNFNFNFL